MEKAHALNVQQFDAIRAVQILVLKRLHGRRPFRKCFKEGAFMEANFCPDY